MMNIITSVDIGRFGENSAADFLKKKGYKIVNKNYHSSHNELDIIAENKMYIAFVEVKTRTISNDGTLNFGSPASYVDRRKQARTISAARNYLVQHPTDKQPRMDVIEVYLKKIGLKNYKIYDIQHIENAYWA